MMYFLCLVMGVVVFGCSEFPPRQVCTSNAICGKDFRCDVPTGRCVADGTQNIDTGTRNIDAAASADSGMDTQDVQVVQSILPCPSDTMAADGLTWQCVEGGVFTMGSDTYDENTAPAREVTVPSFWMLKSEVTVAQYQECQLAAECTSPKTEGATDNYGKGDRTNHPVNSVTYQQAGEFADYIGQGARLPSEAEWEYAARSRGMYAQTPWSGSDGTDCQHAHVWNVESGDAGCNRNQTAVVCSIEAGHSDQGICDLVGNVSEWVADYFHGSYDCVANVQEDCENAGDAPVDGSAWDIASGRRFRVYRGGAWSSDAANADALYRRGSAPDRQLDSRGFRLVRSVE